MFSEKEGDLFPVDTGRYAFRCSLCGDHNLFKQLPEWTLKLVPSYIADNCVTECLRWIDDTEQLKSAMSKYPRIMAENAYKYVKRREAVIESKRSNKT